MPSAPKARDAAPDTTREALIAAALDLFGEKGFDGTSTREIAARAKANSAMIAYYFGSKEGLRRACAEWIVGKIGTIANSVPQPAPEKLNRDTAAAALESIIRAMVGFMLTGRDPEALASFMLREMSHPSSALDVIYGDMMRPLHMRLCQLWGKATGADPESPDTRLAVFAAIGQVMYFRIAREVVTRRMGWQDIGSGEVSQITDLLAGNLRTLLQAARKE